MAGEELMNRAGGIGRLVSLFFAVSLAVGCTAAGTSDEPAEELMDDGPTNGQPMEEQPVSADQCRAGDQQVASQSACLMDDAACYQLADGNWCTGPRGASCPAGSTAVAAGGECPAGSRCFMFSESLQCAIEGPRE